MAKINIPFDNTNYLIDEQSFAAASAELQSHLSTVMNGTGATINFGGATYNVDATKLSNATNTFVSHLGTVSGSGKKVVVGGVEYFIDADKMSAAVAEMHTVLGGLQTGDDGGSDSDSVFPIEWNTMAVMDNASFVVDEMHKTHKFTATEL